MLFGPRDPMVLGVVRTGREARRGVPKPPTTPAKQNPTKNTFFLSPLSHSHLKERRKEKLSGEECQSFFKIVYYFFFALV